MLRLLPACALAASLLVSAPWIRAQEHFTPKDASRLIDRVHDDLNRAYGVWKASNSDRDRLSNAERQLHDFAQKWNKGKFDKGELDGAIAAIQHVLDNNHLPDRERDDVNRDVNELRNLREAYDRHEIH